jgi:hypothetical protein
MFIVSIDNDTNDNDKLFVDQFENERFDELTIQKKRHHCYLYEKSKRDIFFAWWSTSKWAVANTNQNNNKNKKLYWNNDKKAAIWKHFVENAIVEDNTSKIVCKRCHLMLNHSIIKNDINTTKLHLNSKQCFEKFKFNDLFQLTLKKTWKKVSNNTFLMHEHAN